jgi:aryl-alcohol dehydrogenase-like predicted oxidoreductase
MRADGLARQYGLRPPSMEQPQYNMFVRRKVEVEFAPLYRDLGYGTTIWSPLASGVLTGKYNDGIPQGSRMSLPGLDWLKREVTPEKITTVRALEPLAKELDCTLAQLALAWCLKNPDVSTVITGATRADQVTENLKSLAVVPRLTPEVMERIEDILGNRPDPEE